LIGQPTGAMLPEAKQAGRDQRSSRGPASPMDPGPDHEYRQGPRGARGGSWPDLDSNRGPRERFGRRPPARCWTPAPGASSSVGLWRRTGELLNRRLPARAGPGGSASRGPAGRDPEAVLPPPPGRGGGAPALTVAVNVSVDHLDIAPTRPLALLTLPHAGPAPIGTRGRGDGDPQGVVAGTQAGVSPATRRAGGRQPGRLRHRLLGLCTGASRSPASESTTYRPGPG
jgi:hypothetical protein